MYDYNPWQWLLIFYVYCVCGWIFESTVVSVRQRRFVNRGFLKGPMLPIYGFGATIMLHVSLPLMGHPVMIYFAGLVTATAFEYVVGVLMESLFKVKYWDYSDQKFQFQGRICLESSLAWGLLSLLLAYILHKPVARFITSLQTGTTIAAASVTSVWFIYDTVTSAKAAFEFASVLTELEKLRAEAEALRVQLQLGAYEAQDRLEELRIQVRDAQEELRQHMENAQKELRSQVQETQEELRQHMESAQEELRSQVQETQEELRQRLETAKAQFQERLAAREEEARSHEQLRKRLEEVRNSMAEHMQRKHSQYRALLRANPSARSTRFAETFRLWKEREKEDNP